MDEGHIVVDSITEITVADITNELARESGFASVADLLRIARHGSGDKVYLIRFHYLPYGVWDTPKSTNGRTLDCVMKNSSTTNAQATSCRNFAKTSHNSS